MAICYLMLFRSSINYDKYIKCSTINNWTYNKRFKEFLFAITSITPTPGTTNRIRRPDGKKMCSKLMISVPVQGVLEWNTLRRLNFFF